MSPHHGKRRAVAGGTTPVIVSNGNLLDFEFDNLTGWIPTKVGDDTCIVTTEEGLSVHKHDSVGDDDGYINYNKVMFSASSTGVLVSTLNIKHALLDSYALATKYVQLAIGVSASDRPGLNMYSDKIRVGGVNYDYAVPQGEFYDITAVWNLVALTVDIYVNNKPAVTGASYSGAAGYLGQVVTFSRSRPTGYVRNYHYFNRLRVGDGVA